MSQDVFGAGAAVEDDFGAPVLFDGDTGVLTGAQRRALVELLRRQVLTAARHPQEFTTVAAHHELIASRLHDLFLDLVLDRERGIAYKVQVHDADGAGFPVLLRDTAYTREETVLLLFLRRRRLSDRAAGAEHVFVDLRECLEAVESFRPPEATDRAADEQRARKAVASLTAAGILVATAQPERFAVPAVIEVLLPLARIEELTARLEGERTGREDAEAAAEADDTDETETQNTSEQEAIDE